METRLNIEQKISLKLSREIKLSLEILSMSYGDLINFWKKNMEGSYSSIDDSFFENYQEEKNFYQYLEEQLMYLECSKEIKEHLKFCIYNLNNYGFLELSDVELMRSLKISFKKLEEVYKYLYQLHPLGVGTKNFKEAIKLQLLEKNQWSKNIEIVLNNLELVAENKEQEIMDKYGINGEEYKKCLQKIKQCNPIPSRGFFIEKTKLIIPDFYLKIENKQYKLQRNEELYKNLYKVDMKDNKNIEMLRKCIEHRAETLEKITLYILEKQKRFFIENLSLEKLYQNEVARYLEMHESTISRAIRDKYIRTEKGIFSLKSFFNYSNEKEKVKRKIEELIKSENKSKPYSDEQIRKYLKENYFLDIARRTVSKYREELGYESSIYRKNFR